MISLLDFDLRTIALGIAGILLIVCGVALSWQDSTIDDQAAQISSLDHDVSIAVSANRQANATVARLERSAASTSVITADWAQWALPVHDASRSAAITIEGDNNETFMDCIMSVNIERGLDRLRQQACAAGGQCPISGGRNSSGAIFASKDNPEAPGGASDSSQAGAVDSLSSGDNRTQRGRQESE